MRIASGQYRGRVLKVPSGLDVRPTADKVRQAVFNILFGMGYPSNAQVLDGFCGTGALGIEALSRGAAHCTFLDLAKASLDCCNANLAMVGADDAATVLKLDATRPGSRPARVMPMDLIFLDPPYNRNLPSLALSALGANDWLTPGAIGVIETAKDEAFEAAGFTPLDVRVYGSTKVTFVRYGGAVDGAA